jgi:hypothetical protein
MNGLAVDRPGQGDPHVPRDAVHGGAEAVVRVVALVVVAAHVSAILIAGGWAWGGDAYAFLPRPALWWGLGAAAALALLATWRPPRPSDVMIPRASAGPSPQAAVAASVVAIGAGLVFWVFRIRHVLLGDGIPITALLPDTHEIHPREPLASLLQQVFYRVLSPVFARPGIPRAVVVQDCVAIGSVLAGVLFVGVARALAGEIVRTFPAQETENRRWLTWGLTVVLLAQGYVQMFFGYVENYAYPAVVAALYMVLSLRYLRGAGSILWPLATAALGVALDFTGVVLGPSVLVLVGVGLLDGARRRAVFRDLLLALGVTGVGVWWVSWRLHYSIAGNLVSMFASAHASTAYIFSVAHVRDFVNEHLLLGPFGLFLFIPAVALLAWRGERPRAPVVFLLVAAASVVLACWSTPDLPMGYARDWDLFIPLGVVLTGASIALTMGLMRGAGARWRTTALIAAVSLFHTVPWIALNTSEVRSVERFKSLPLGGGRTENSVAFWYAQHGDLREAKRWLKRSLAINPNNARALDLYGRIGFDEHDARLALQSYLIAVALRPDKTDFRQQLATAVAAAGGPAAGLRQLDTLMVGHEDNGALWFERAMLLRASGRLAEAAEAKARAARLRPDLASAVDSLPTLTPR